jgi:hypothetical protein
LGAVDVDGDNVLPDEGGRVGVLTSFVGPGVFLKKGLGAPVVGPGVMSIVGAPEVPVGPGVTFVGKGVVTNKGDNVGCGLGGTGLISSSSVGLLDSSTVGEDVITEGPAVVGSLEGLPDFTEGVPVTGA